VIEEDIRRARTLPAAFYRDPAIFEQVRERVFARSWQLVDGAERAAVPGSVLPFALLEGCVDEPLLLARDAGGVLRGLSNVCTHRGNLLCTEPAVVQGLRCRYHGRRFALDGRFVAMPEFEGVVDFPSPADDLPRIQLGRLGPLLFAAVDPALAFEELAAPVRERMAFVPLDRLAPDPAGSRSYELAANWALYCDNYLEGFHVPFVHAALAKTIDYGSYRSELFAWSSLQVAEAAAAEDAFDGTKIAACYFFLFPNTMLNFYPWGLSINVVVPLAVDRTRVIYRSWVLDASRRGKGAGAALDRVELEDEEIVQQVQKGIRSRLYDRGRYSPAREAGVHHFHRLLARTACNRSREAISEVDIPRRPAVDTRTWVVLADAASAKLYESKAGEREWKLVTELSHPEGRAKESELVSDKPGRVQQSSGGKSAMEPPTPRKKVEVDRFAREVARKLDDAAAQGSYERLILVAAPAFLGALRKHLPDRVQKHVAATVEKDYLHLDPREVRERIGEQIGPR